MLPAERGQPQVKNQNRNFGKPYGCVLAILQDKDELAAIDPLPRICRGQGGEVESVGEQIAISLCHNVDGDDECGVEAKSD